MFVHYFQKIKDLLDEIQQDENENLKKAGQKLAQCIQKNRIVHVFGCGHSHMFGEELFYRAGGLAPINPILIEDVMLHKGGVRSSHFEQKNDFAEQFMPDIMIEPDDIMIVVSTSGRNPVAIDVAEIAKKKGAFVIAITSPAYAKSQSSRHKNGKYLLHCADLVIDNHIEAGDALLKDESFGITFGPGSTVIGMAIMNGIIAEAVKGMVGENFVPPVFKSGNVDGAEEYNKRLVRQYVDRIPLLDRKDSNQL